MYVLYPLNTLYYNGGGVGGLGVGVGEGGKRGGIQIFYAMYCLLVLICTLCQKMVEKFTKTKKFVTRTLVSTNGTFTSIFLLTFYKLS